MLEWVACSFSSGSSWPRNRTGVSCTAGRFFTNWAIKEAQWSRSKCFLWNSLALSMIQWMLAIWSLVPLPFLNIWKFLVHVLLKPSLMDFEHYHARIWNKCDCMVVGTFLGIVLLVTGMKIDLFQSCGHCWVFQICWHIEFRTLTASSFRTSNSSAGIPSLALA